jgi:hypothetical protein
VILKVIAQRVFQSEVSDIDCGIADNGIHMSNIEIMRNVTAIDLVYSFQAHKIIEIIHEKALQMKLTFHSKLSKVSMNSQREISFNNIHMSSSDAATVHFFSIKVVSITLKKSDQT